MALVDAETGEPVEPVMMDPRSGRVVRAPEFKVAEVKVPSPRAASAKGEKNRTRQSKQ
jgi:hypothetical protein